MARHRRDPDGQLAEFAGQVENEAAVDEAEAALGLGWHTGAGIGVGDGPEQELIRFANPEPFFHEAQVDGMDEDVTETAIGQGQAGPNAALAIG